MSHRLASLRLALFCGFIALTASATHAQVAKPKAKPGGNAKASESAGTTATEKNPVDEKASKDAAKKTEIAVFGGGCFWCLEAVFERVTGVKDVVSGYSGGFIRRPTYDLVLTGETGHAEVVQITYDPEQVTYEELLKVFWVCHDPTSLNAQGPDFGTQYRSIILAKDEVQLAAAQKSLLSLESSGSVSGPIVTEIVPLKAFYAAEKYHQDYYRKHKNVPYCQANITPKLEALKIKFSADAKAKK
jgi:peptide-methionine (S)-S-oxide reductase